MDYPRNVPESEDEVSDSEMKDEDTYSENGISDKVNTQKVTKSDTTSEAILEIESANSENQSHEELEIKHEECVELVCKHNLPADLSEGHEMKDANSLLFAKEESDVKIVEGKCSENSLRISNITDTSQETVISVPIPVSKIRILETFLLKVAKYVIQIREFFLLH